MIRRSSAVWLGTGKEGKGSLTSTSGVLINTPYNTSARFENEDGKAGTNPEELIAAAHAGCFSMALSFQLTEAGFTEIELKTEAAVKIEPGEKGFSITSIQLSLTGSVPGISQDEFIRIANAAKEGCPVSKALSAVPISLNAKLV